LTFEIFNPFFKVKVQNSKHFFNLTKFAFWASQGAENQLKVQFQPCDLRKFEKAVFLVFLHLNYDL